MVSLDPASGHEQKGYRPVLIVSSTAFNAASRLPVIVPVTSGGNFARAMGMSAHTVQQHLKAMFTKTASSSRGELVARSCGAALTTAGDAASGERFDVALAG